MRSLLMLAGGVFALGGLALCVWLSLTSVLAAFAVMAGLAIAAVGAIVLIVRREQRPERRPAAPLREESRS